MPEIIKELKSHNLNNIQGCDTIYPVTVPDAIIIDSEQTLKDVLDVLHITDVDQKQIKITINIPGSNNNSSQIVFNTFAPVTESDKIINIENPFDDIDSINGEINLLKLSVQNLLSNSNNLNNINIELNNLSNRLLAVEQEILSIKADASDNDDDIPQAPNETT